jgi:hypothetical protein
MKESRSMSQHRFALALALSFVLALLGPCANRAFCTNEQFSITEDPPSPPPPAPSNVVYLGGNATFTFQIQETSGQADTINIYYSCVDSATPPNNLTCTPSQTSASISKGLANVVDSSSTVSLAGSQGNITMTCYVVGQTYGGSQTFAETVSNTRGRGIHAHGKLPRTTLTPVVQFFPLQDYLVPVNISLQGLDNSVKMTYAATAQTGGGPATRLTITPTSEIVNVGTHPTKRLVLIHAYQQTGTISFTATATTSGHPPVTLPAPAVTYTIPASPGNATTNTNSTIGLTINSGPIAPTNQYVAAVSFPSQDLETHVHAYYHAWDATPTLLPPEPDSSNFDITIGTLNTTNVLLDCSSITGNSITFQVDGVGAHSGTFFLNIPYTLQAQ